jgi:hypothetical protein
MNAASFEESTLTSAVVYTIVAPSRPFDMMRA